MVSIVRGQIADPHLVAKARAGRADEVRPCISCNQLCWGRRSRDYWISCLVNPSAGREWEWGGDRFEPAARATDGARRRRRAGGAGGGAGRGGARARGHALGARRRARRPVPAGRPAADRAARSSDLLAWHGVARGARRRRAPGHRRSARTRSRPSGADEVVVATGSRPAGPGSSARCRWSTGSPGSTARTCSSIHDVLDGTAVAGRRVLVLDDVDDWRGLGTALSPRRGRPRGDARHARPRSSPSGLFHSAADGPLRRRYAKAGGTILTGRHRSSPGATAWRSSARR